MTMGNVAPPATERTLRALLQFRIDPRGITALSIGGSEIEKALDNMDDVLANAESSASSMEYAVLGLSRALGYVGTRDAEAASQSLKETVKQFNKGEIGVRGLEDAVNALEDTIVAAVVFQGLSKELNQLRRDASLAKEEIQDLANTAQALESLGNELAGYAALITSPLRTFAADYIRMAGESDDASKAWLDTTEKLADAQTRLGGVAVESILPLMELTADVMEKAADFAERYPELVQAVFGIGTAMVLASSLQTAVTKGIRLVADAKVILISTKRFLAAQMNRRAADKMLVAATLHSKAAATEAATAGAGVGGVGKGVLAGIGGLGGAAAALAVTAAVAAWVAVGIKAKGVADDAQKQTDSMGNRWSVFFEENAAETEDAIQLANRYNAAQRRINEAYDEGGIVASIFFDREKMVNASQGQINDALQKSATGYEDYVRAVMSLNRELGRDEKAIALVNRATFEQTQKMAELREAYIKGTASLRDIAEAQLESNNGLEQLAGLVNMIAALAMEEMTIVGLVDDWDELQERIAASGKTYRDEQDAAWDTYFEEKEKADEANKEELARIANEYEQAVLKLSLDTATERERIVGEMGEELAEKEEDAAKRRQELMQNFVDDMNEAEDDYYADRAERAAEFGIDMARAEQDHQIAMRRMREDSMVRQKGAIRSRDAIALLEERRDYERDRGRAEEDFSIQMMRRNEDFARQMQQMEQSFAQQQEARQKAFDEQIKELNKAKAEEKAVLDKAKEEQLIALEEQRVVEGKMLYEKQDEETASTEEHNEKTKAELLVEYRKRRDAAKRAQYDELRDAYDSWTDKRQAAGVFLSGEMTQLNAHYNARLTALRNWMSSANAIVRGSNVPPPNGRAGGGYVTAGNYRVGEEGYEFVLSNATTRMAEGMAGGNLTQGGLRGMMGGGKTIQFTQHLTIEDGRDPEKTAALVREETLQVMNDVIEQVN